MLHRRFGADPIGRLADDDDALDIDDMALAKAHPETLRWAVGCVKGNEPHQLSFFRATFNRKQPISAQSMAIVSPGFRATGGMSSAPSRRMAGPKPRMSPGR